MFLCCHVFYNDHVEARNTIILTLVLYCFGCLANDERNWVPQQHFIIRFDQPECTHTLVKFIALSYLLTTLQYNFIRSGDFTHTYDTKVYDIELYHYVVAPHEFYNASAYPPNYGYSAFGKEGVLNLTAVFPQSQ